jgi:hypothetical protein
MSYSLNRCAADPLVHHGRHFGRAVHALCSVPALLSNGILRLGVLADKPESTFTHEYVSVNKDTQLMIMPHFQGSKRASYLPEIARFHTGVRGPSNGGFQRRPQAYRRTCTCCSRFYCVLRLISREDPER